MQVFYSVISFIIILHALFLQSAWLFLGRMSRDRYLRDIMTFRSPSSKLSRYYSWRVDTMKNALSEGAVFLLLLIISIIGLSILLFSIEALLEATLIVAFVVILSFISAMQHAWRVKEVLESETRIVSAIKSSVDKIGVTRRMVDDLYMQGTMGDGRMWFALFRLAQRPDPVGWSIRDVLIDKAKEEEERFQKKGPDYGAVSTGGPEIDSN
ncbi:MAG: hypothetical protein JW779_16400 [Candidatus Thorarchaeota archaeon]|nr:hypothetical protein [Candidatus Thorarchaeota archaeon]